MYIKLGLGVNKLDRVCQSVSMPRKPRIEYPGAIDHGMSRGDRREDTFLNDVDRQDFVKTLAEAYLKAQFQVHAYCLMRNHFP